MAVAVPCILDTVLKTRNQLQLIIHLFLSEIPVWEQTGRSWRCLQLFFFCHCTLHIFSNAFLRCRQAAAAVPLIKTGIKLSLKVTVFLLPLWCLADEIQPALVPSNQFKPVVHNFVLAQEEVEKAGVMEDTGRGDHVIQQLLFFLLKMFIGLWPGSSIWHP